MALPPVSITHGVWLSAQRATPAITSRSTSISHLRYNLSRRRKPGSWGKPIQRPISVNEVPLQAHIVRSLAISNASQGKHVNPWDANLPAQKLLPAPDIPIKVRIIGRLQRAGTKECYCRGKAIQLRQVASGIKPYSIPK